MRLSTRMKAREFKPRFVEDIPKSQDLEEGILYISIQHSIVTHLCACGCGTRIDTPLAPDEWTMIYDGEKVSLRPSIGNWDIACQSHYFITENKVDWLHSWYEVDSGHCQKKKGRWKRLEKKFLRDKKDR
jgi:hypothetical protein